MISRIVVVLPAPFGPMTPYSAPVGHGEIEIVHRGRRSECLPDAVQAQRGVSSRQPLISRTTRRADSNAPCIQPVQADVCSPAK